MQNILNEILIRKKDKIKEYKKNYPIKNILVSIKNTENFVDFKQKIKNREKEKKISIIAEIKKKKSFRRNACQRL